MMPQTEVKDVDWRVDPWVDRRTNTRIVNALQRNGIHTIEQLVQRRYKDFRAGMFPGIGEICLKLIVRKLHKMGLRLK